MSTFVIAEIGVNHNGKLDLALQLVEAAAAAGAQAAKFQTFKADALTSRGTATVAYQKRAANAVDQHSMLKALELSADDHHVVARRCEDVGIEFMSTAFDRESLDLLCDLGIRRIKVPSGEVTNTPYLEDCARRGLPIILSTGMADLEEVQSAVATLRNSMRPLPVTDAAGLPALTVLHCTSAYPTALGDVNLSAMTTIAKEVGVPVGYSDHSEGIFVAPMAVALGARIIEKHVTLDRNLPGPDHSASIEPLELQAMMRAIASVELVLGDGVKAARESELEARRLVRRGIKAARDLNAGDILTEDDIAILRPATGIAPMFLGAVVGKSLTRDLAAGFPIEVTDIE